MRRPHPSYDMFVKEQTPKYGKTFVEWFSENSKISGVSTFDLLQKQAYEDSYEDSSFYRDGFSKKLCICNSLIQGFMSINDFGAHPIMKYGLDKVADVMDLYEDIIKLIVERPNVGVTQLPSGCLRGGQFFGTESITFENFGQLNAFFETGFIIVYNFLIREDGSIVLRSFKHETITREVLFEKTYL